jgi:HEAT repeat protein
MGRRLMLAAALGAALMAGPGPAPGAADAAADEQTLRAAKIGTDGASLLDYFRRRTVGEAERQQLERLIRQLGDDAYPARERAAAALVRAGLPAVGLLRQAVLDADVEVARRAERCLKQIERVPSTTLSAAAARLLALRKPPGAVEVLLNYLPLADDEAVAEELREALAAVALRDGRPDPLLDQALENPLPLRRGAAAEALIRTGRPAAVEASRKALADGNADVRLRAALALVTHAKDTRAVPPMIELLAELPQAAGWKVEEVLIRLAGESAPAAPLGSDDAARQKCRDAWLAWWGQHGATADLAKLDAAPATLGYTLVVLRDRGGGTGRVVELTAAREVHWKIDGLSQPFDAVVVGKDRLLVAEWGPTHQVSEFDFRGRRLWSKPVSQPFYVQRLANGHTFIACRNQLVEWDADRREVYTVRREQHDISAAAKMRTGEIVYLTTAGTCVRLDAHRREVRSYSVGRRVNPFGALEVLATGHVLLALTDAVAEFDADGRQVWSAPYTRPSSVQRLANGNTLVASTQTLTVAELDRQGQPVWEYKPGDNAMPWRARRR